MARELVVFNSCALVGSLIATCAYNYPLNATWQCAKEIGQKTLLYTVIGFSSITLSSNLAFYIKGRVKLIRTDEAAGRTCCAFLAASIVPIYFSAKAFPRTVGTPAEALLGVATSIAFGVLSFIIFPKKEQRG